MKNFATRSALALTALTLAHATPELVPQDDAGLAEFVGMTFNADERLAGESIRISVDNGIATLTGRVATLNQAERAVERSKSVEGIRAVVSRIKVAAARTGDDALAAEISRRLSAVPDTLQAGAVTVSVRKGVATLDGRVTTWDEQELARELASEVPGIAIIDNRLEATGRGRRSDRAIRWQIERDLNDDPLNDGLNLSVSVNDGRVSLSGEVGTRGEKDLLARRAGVAGVTTVSTAGVDIVRSLSMEGMTGKTPGASATLAALEAALRSDKRLGNALIQPDLDGRVLTLHGTVRTAELKAAAESTARGVPGVEIVVNRIQTGNDRRVAALDE